MLPIDFDILSQVVDGHAGVVERLERYGQLEALALCGSVAAVVFEFYISGVRCECSAVVVAVVLIVPVADETFLLGIKDFASVAQCHLFHRHLDGVVLGSAEYQDAVAFDVVVVHHAPVVIHPHCVALHHCGEGGVGGAAGGDGYAVDEGEVEGVDAVASVGGHAAMGGGGGIVSVFHRHGAAVHGVAVAAQTCGVAVAVNGPGVAGAPCHHVFLYRGVGFHGQVQLADGGAGAGRLYGVKVDVVSVAKVFVVDGNGVRIPCVARLAFANRRLVNIVTFDIIDPVDGGYVSDGASAVVGHGDSR